MKLHTDNEKHMLRNDNNLLNTNEKDQCINF
jgi:hypothetical protein